MRVISRIGSLLKTHPLSHAPHCMFSQSLAGLVREGLLQLRNSETLELKLARFDAEQQRIIPLDLQLPSTATVGDLKQRVRNEFELENEQCNVPT